MGKVTGTLYASIYFVLCGMGLAAGFEAWTLTWVLWGLAVAMLLTLCIFGYRLDALAGEPVPVSQTGHDERQRRNKLVISGDRGDGIRHAA